MSWLEDIARSTCDPKQGCDAWAYAHNYLAEGRLTPARRDKYEAHCAALKLPTGASWTYAHSNHVQKTVKVTKPFVAETFHAINDGAQTELGDDLVVLRCEDLTRALANHQCRLDDLRTWLAVRDGSARKNIKVANAQSKIRDFLDDWNGRRSYWPAFAAFEHELGAASTLGKSDWPHQIRDRLGLAHYDGKVGTPVALMRVPVPEIKAAASTRQAEAFARPTVLDGEMNRYYFPTPVDFDFGATLHLDPAHCGRAMTAEILCFPVDYRVDHLIAVGLVDRLLPPHCLRELRNRHLAGLQQEPGGAGFGAVIACEDCTAGAPCR